MARELRVVARWLRIKVRCIARRALGGALWGFSLVLWPLYGALYSACALAHAVAAAVVAGVVAMVCVLVSGE